MDGSIEYILSKYEEIELIAENSKSKIFLVKDNITNRVFVKKVLPRNSSIDIYKKLTGKVIKNTPKIYHAFTDEASNYIIEEYISGTSLVKLLASEKSFSANQVKEWTIMLCNILSTLHNYTPPIIHRDIKPSNIIISDDGILKLIDFDIAREYKEDVTTDTDYIGTKKYAAPEQYGFSQTDCRSDIFSVGILMAELLAGHLPSNKPNFNDYGHVGKIIQKCMEVDPSKRYQNIDELKKAIEKLNKPSYKKQIIIIGCIASASILLAIPILALRNPRIENDIISNVDDFPYYIEEINEVIPYVAESPVQIKPSEVEDVQGEEQEMPVEGAYETLQEAETEDEIEAAQEMYVEYAPEAVYEIQEEPEVELKTYSENNELEMEYEIQTEVQFPIDAPSLEQHTGFPDLSGIRNHTYETHTSLINNPVVDRELRGILGGMYDEFMQDMAFFLSRDPHSFLNYTTIRVDGVGGVRTRVSSLDQATRTTMMIMNDGYIYLLWERDSNRRNYYFTNNINRASRIPPILGALTSRPIVFKNANENVALRQGVNVYCNGRDIVTITLDGDALFFNIVLESHRIPELTTEFNGQTTLDGTFASFSGYAYSERSRSDGSFRGAFNFSGNYLTLWLQISGFCFEWNTTFSTHPNHMDDSFRRQN